MMWTENYGIENLKIGQDIVLLLYVSYLFKPVQMYVFQLIVRHKPDKQFIFCENKNKYAR